MVARVINYTTIYMPRFGGLLFFLLFFLLQRGCATAPILPTRACARTTDTPLAFFLLLIDVHRGGDDDHRYDADNDPICHTTFLFTIVCAPIFLSARTHSHITTAVIAATAISPGKKPAPSMPVVISVPT